MSIRQPPAVACCRAVQQAHVPSGFSVRNSTPQGVLFLFVGLKRLEHLPALPNGAGRQGYGRVDVRGFHAHKALVTVGLQIGKLSAQLGARVPDNRLFQSGRLA